MNVICIMVLLGDAQASTVLGTVQLRDKETALKNL